MDKIARNTGVGAALVRGALAALAAFVKAGSCLALANALVSSPPVLNVIGDATLVCFTIAVAKPVTHGALSARGRRATLWDPRILFANPATIVDTVRRTITAFTIA